MPPSDWLKISAAIILAVGVCLVTPDEGVRQAGATIGLAATSCVAVYGLYLLSRFTARVKENLQESQQTDEV